MKDEDTPVSLGAPFVKPLRGHSHVLWNSSIRAKKHRGQHFLTDKNILKKIVDAAHIQPTDTVVEIGAGTGNLTELLAQKAQRVIAFEIDRELIPVLKNRLCHFGNLEIIHDDARDFDPAHNGLHGSTVHHGHAARYRVVANIPYNITSLLIRRFLEADPPPEKMILLVQREVAERICATPPNMSILSVAVQYYAHPRILFSVPRACFSPRPHVESAVVLFTQEQENNPGPSEFFFRIIRAGFAHKRKLLISNLSGILGIPRERITIIFSELCIPSTVRAQELSVKQWRALADAFSTLPL